MTAAHVVDNMGEIFITERSGFTYGAKVKHMDYKTETLLFLLLRVS